MAHRRAGGAAVRVDAGAPRRQDRPLVGLLGPRHAHRCAVGHVDIAGVSFSLPDGRPLLRDVSLRVGEGAKIALIGPNGTGKTTLTRIIAGDLVA